MGQYFLGHMPTNGVVPWDFNAPLVQNGVPRPADSSAAMIATAGMLLLAHQEEIIGNASGRAWWATQAMNVRRSAAEHRQFGADGRGSCTTTTSNSRGSRRGRACSRTGR
jgi:hypothetical protein